MLKLNRFMFLPLVRTPNHLERVRKRWVFRKNECYFFSKPPIFTSRGDENLVADVAWSFLELGKPPQLPLEGTETI